VRGRGRARVGLAAGLLATGVASADTPRDVWYQSGRKAVAEAMALRPNTAHAKNVILFVGDGMGITTVTAARILEGQQRGQTGEENVLAFEELPDVALIKTYNTNQQTPDSAGTMTAMMTGVKTRAGVLGIDETVARGDASGVKGHELQTLFQRAEERGLATGIVTTTTVTHATPAACYAHSPERTWENDARQPRSARSIGFPDIARQLIEFSEGDGIDVVLGGGRSHFMPTDQADPEYPTKSGSRKDGRDLTAEWVKDRPRARYVWNQDQFDDIDPEKTDRLLGLFEPSHMHYEIDRNKDVAGEPALHEMTQRAIEILGRRDAGFLLMVEGGRIDHAHHMTNAYRALIDTIELSRAVRTAMALTDPRETLIVVTADHGHVFTIGGYPTRGNPILGTVVENDSKGEPRDDPAQDDLGLPYTTLGYQNGPGYSGASTSQPEGPKTIPNKGFMGDRQGITAGRPNLTRVDTTHRNYLQESSVPLQLETHSAEDVPLYAGGPRSYLFHGVQEQHFVYHAIVEALGWNAPEPEAAEPIEFH